MRVASDACIALGVYNGSAYLKEQINSLLAQRDLSFEIISRDDGSQDDSPTILKEFSNRNPRISVLQDNKGNLGVAGNFGLLMHAATQTPCEYIASSDQDDVWCENKLAEQYALMREMEKQYPEKPVLVHSDLEVVDFNLNCIDASFMRYRGIRNEPNHPVKVLLATNFVTGSTVLVNRRLLGMALPFPKEAIIHDWWLALCAAVFGHIAYIDKPLVKYRQHANNEIGAKSLKAFMNPFKTNWHRQWLKGRDILSDSLHQAQALYHRVKEHDPSNPYRSLIERHASLESLSPLKRLQVLSQLGVHAQGNIRHAFLLSRLLCLPPPNKP